MKYGITLLHHLLLAGRKDKMIPVGHIFTCQLTSFLQVAPSPNAAFFSPGVEANPAKLNWNINLGPSDGTWHCSTSWSILVQIMVCYPVWYLAINITNVNVLPLVTQGSRTLSSIKIKDFWGDFSITKPNVLKTVMENFPEKILQCRYAENILLKGRNLTFSAVQKCPFH